MSTKDCILVIDFGSTSLTVNVYDKQARILISESVKVPYCHPEPNAVEIDPDELWKTFVDLVKATLDKKEVISRIKAFGICSQRGTIILWNKTTGKPYCNLLSWLDQRCGNVVAKMNGLWMKKSINVLGSFLYTFLRSQKFMLMKAMQFQMGHSSMKLMWYMESHPEITAAMAEKDVLFGTLDTWIMWKLSKGKVHLTDYSNASATGMWDPYICDWSALIPLLLGAPFHIFPQFIDTSGHFLDIHEDIFGVEIPLTAVVGDTQATAFGQCCFDLGDASCTLGTGCFITINTGSDPHASIKGVYPQVGWKLKDELVYLCEGHNRGIATSIEWAKTLELFDNVAEISDIAKSVEDTGGLYFIPAFSGLSAPYQDPNACTGLIGIKNGFSSKAHILRAILEGIAFRFFQMYCVIREETDVHFDPVLKASGGVANNDFIMELISSLTGCTIHRMQDQDTSLLGTAFLAGLGAGIWKSKEEVRPLSRVASVIKPNPELRKKYESVYEGWQKAVKRCLQWYT